MDEQNDSFAKRFRLFLRHIDCYRLVPSGQQAELRDVDFRVKRSPDGEKIFVVIRRDELPVEFGYSAFQAHRHELAKSMDSPIELRRRNGHIVIKLLSDGAASRKTHRNRISEHTEVAPANSAV